MAACDDDGLGSTTGLANSSGSVTDTYTYDAFGALRSDPPTHSNKFRFTGEQQDYDVANDLYYLRARYYDPALGRFWTQDPRPGTCCAPQTLNRYAYVAGNPVSFADPFGLCPQGQLRVGPVPTPPPTITPVPGSTSAAPVLGGDMFCYGPSGGNAFWSFIGDAAHSLWDHCEWWAWTAGPGWISGACYGYLDELWEVAEFLATRSPDCYALTALATGLVIVSVDDPELWGVTGPVLITLQEPLVTSCLAD